MPSLKHMPDKMLDAAMIRVLETLIANGKGYRLDKRSVSYGYWVAAAALMSATGQHAMIELYQDRAAELAARTKATTGLASPLTEGHQHNGIPPV